MAAAQQRLRSAVVGQPSLVEQIRAVSDGPLLELHCLGDHHRESLRMPRRGDPDLSWVVGVGGDGTLIWHHFRGANAPHLLIAGATGTGKGNLMSLMLCHLMHNTNPADVRFWLVDFQGEIADFRQRLPRSRRGPRLLQSPRHDGPATPPRRRRCDAKRHGRRL